MDVDISQVVVRRDDTVVRTWPVNSVHRAAGQDGTTVFSVANDRVYLKADDPVALAADLGQLPVNGPPPPPVAVPAVRAEVRPATTRLKDPGLAVVFSFFITGLGQLYNGEIGKAVAFFGAQIVSAILMFVLIGFVTTPALWIWSMVDAYRRAEEINRQLTA